VVKRTMMDQFFELKAAHPDTILFFRMGDFYELFHDDATVAAEVLGLSLTSRDKNAAEPIPMAGFPWHGLEEHLKTMLNAGYKVTVAEQEDELREGAKLLERVATRIYTPGSLYEEQLLNQDDRSMLAGITVSKDRLGLAGIDASTGQAWAVMVEGHDRWTQAVDHLQRWQPKELVVDPKQANIDEVRQLLGQLEGTMVSNHNASEAKRTAQLTRSMEVIDAGHLDLDSAPQATSALGLVTDYLCAVHLTEHLHLREVNLMEADGHLLLDQTTLRNLELTTTLAGEYEGSLLSTLNRCRTAMGRRLLKSWLLQPLTDRSAIQARHAAVGSLARSAKRLDGMRTTLNGVRDMERLATLLTYGRSNARDLLATGHALERMPALERWCLDADDPLLHLLQEGLTQLDETARLIQATLNDSPPLGLRDGGLLKQGVDEEVDRLRQLTAEGKSWFSSLETSLRQALNIPSLKVRMNRQIGWFIEVTKTNEHRVPEDWRRKQQMTNGSRYVTDELVKRDDELLGADAKLKELEYRKFLELRAYCGQQAHILSDIARRVASIDVLQCFATVARERSWTKPELTDRPTMSIQGARHPVLESMAGFVPNDIDMRAKRSFLLITGPNMGGKSTYLRTAALITVLAQAGAYVPAAKANIGLVDRIFTRVGASDDLRRGRSTFMMEMIEVAHILKRATPRSLVLLDEIGRGTSTFDGLSIAWAVTEDICQRLAARTLFATHYHQLVGLEDQLSELVNVHVEVAQVDGQLRFLHTVAEGPCDDSYGVQVAALAGLPRHVVERATDLLAFLEAQAHGAKAGETGAPTARDKGQASLMGYFAAAAMGATASTAPTPHPEHEVRALERLKSLNVDDMSPREALQALYELKSGMEGAE
jgi:DNA mismatch repair protein MutS